MDGFLREELQRLFTRRAITLRKPKFKSQPFKVDFEILDADPIAREVVFRLLGARVDAGVYDMIASVPDDCRNLAAMYAAKEAMPLVQPVEITPDEFAPLMLYGKACPDCHVLIIAAVNKIEREQKMAIHPIIRTLNVLRQNRLKPRKIIVLFDADKCVCLKQAINEISGSGIAYEAIFDMTDVFRLLLSEPESFDLTEKEIVEAEEHYKSM